MERRPIVIIGSGPAGSATGLELQRTDAALASEILILEKAQHPRVKVCAGGLIPHTLERLRILDVPLTVPNALADRAHVEIPGSVVDYEGQELCRVVRRDEFDAALASACRSRGVEIRENEKVTALAREGSGVRIETERASYHAQVVVGADGSGSLVRRRMVPFGRHCVGKAIMTDVPVDRIDWNGFQAQRYDFSFTAVPRGLRGYVWAFPCLVAGKPHANIGVYSVDAAGSGAFLQQLLREEIDRLGAPRDLSFQSFPIRWYGRSVRIAAPHVLLAGDAAGVDALMGEGISYALEYGERAAKAARNALAVSQFDFAGYERDVSHSWLGKKLRRLEMSSRLFYGRSSPLWFAIAAKSRSAQEIGIRWYNGVDGWDRRSGWEALAAWWRGAVAPAGAATR
ncbi:MAG TPA: FAD-dependent oxidoreductase, partial [Candidatus Acidoferrales bacterium]|nr:FAD-dependent oxidoreductase [Candidatus Acidoferrales bacterium]